MDLALELVLWFRMDDCGVMVGVAVAGSAAASFGSVGALFLEQQLPILPEGSDRDPKLWKRGLAFGK